MEEFVIRKRVVLIDIDRDHNRIVTNLLDNAAKFKVIDAYVNLENAIRNLKKDRPDIILIDSVISSNEIVFHFIQKARKVYSNVEIVINSSHEDDEILFGALKAGACGFILKSVNYNELLDGLNDLIKGGAPLSRNIAKRLIEYHRIDCNSPLTKQETRVLQLVAKANSYTQIGKHLFISSETVKAHIRNIYKKLKVHRKSEAIDIAFRERLI